MASLLGTSGSPSSPGMALTLHPTALSLTGRSPGTAWSWCKGSNRFQTVVSRYLDSYGPCGWSLDSHPHGHHSMTVIKTVRFCHYIFSKINKVVLPGNKMPLSTFVLVINTLFQSLNLKNFHVSYFISDWLRRKCVEYDYRFYVFILSKKVLFILECKKNPTTTTTKKHTTNVLELFNGNKKCYDV